MGSYCPRLIDKEIELELDAFGAVLIVGPKWCGKTTSALRISKSVIQLQDPEKRDAYRALAEIRISELLKGEKPRLIDEWQDIPKIWDAVRIDVDRNGDTGQYILTGSRVSSDRGIMHSGTGRISVLRMHTLSLFESGDSNGSVSLRSLFDNLDDIASSSSCSISDYARLIVRGGWPQSLGKSDMICRRQIKGYCESILSPKAGEGDGKRRDPRRMRDIMRSLSRCVSAPISKKGIIGDVGSKEGDTEMSLNTVNDYLSELRSIHVLEELPAWNPNLRSKTAMRTTDTVHLCDPAIAAYFLGASVEDLLNDPNTLGLLFESLVIRDLRVYTESIGGEVFHYRDKNGLEADAVIHLHDGRWGAVEVKLGSAWVEGAAKNLLKLSHLVTSGSGRAPSFLAVITSTEYAYRRNDGVFVIPLACLRD